MPTPNESTSGTSALGAFENKLSLPSTSSLAIPSTSGSSSLGISSCQKKVSPLKERYVPSNIMPDSFRTYRGRGMAQSSDSEDSNASYVHSCACSSCSDSEFGYVIHKSCLIFPQITYSDFSFQVKL